MATYSRTADLARNLRQLKDEGRARRRRIALRNHPGGVKKRTGPWSAGVWAAAISIGFIATGWYWTELGALLDRLGI